jgi:hypothetical protein
MPTVEDRRVWEDDFMKGAAWCKNFLDILLSERGQMYGTLIHLFLKNGITEIELPTRDVLNSYGRDYYMLFNKKEDGGFYLTLKEQEQNEQPIEKTVLD